MKYNWQQTSWMNFTYDASSIEKTLFTFSERAGRVSGLMSGLTDELQTEALLELMVAEAVKTSEIEGEMLSRADVMSSIRKNLGLGTTTQSSDQRATGVANLMLLVRNTYSEPLSGEALCNWHSQLMLGNQRVKIGTWRDHTEPMQVVSGPIGKETIHYEAPPSKAVSQMMIDFFSWFNRTAPNGEKSISSAPIRSAIAHLYFETVHPFEDGNGRIGRAISEKALSQGLGRPVLLSLSQSIQSDKKAYYKALKAAQRSNEITPWLDYFANLCLDAQIRAEIQIEFTLKKSQFFDRYKSKINDRQAKVLVRMFEAGPTGFTGGMSAKKYIAITQTSKPTATRDLRALAELGTLIVTGGGRSTRYWLPDDPLAKIS